MSGRPSTVVASVLLAVAALAGSGCYHTVAAVPEPGQRLAAVRLIDGDVVRFRRGDFATWEDSAVVFRHSATAPPTRVIPASEVEQAWVREVESTDTGILLGTAAVVFVGWLFLSNLQGST